MATEHSETLTTNASRMEAFFRCLADLTILFRLEAIQAFIRYSRIVLALAAHKQTPAKVTSKPIEEPWPEPKDDPFQGSTKVLWGFWDGGEEKLPGFCQMAVSSWKAKHPGWKVVILSDTNYKQYVSASDIPSTFDSLKVQHRSDILRLAVLIRYGGIYMDVSAITLKGMNQIWTEASEDQLLFASHLTLECGVPMSNNHLIIARGRNNPVLQEWRRLVLEYTENPCGTEEEMKKHPLFQRVAPYFNDPNLGITKDSNAYLAILWLQMDVLNHNDKLASFVQKNVRYLPTRRWTFDFVCLTSSFQDGRPDPPPPAFGLFQILGLTIRSLAVIFRDDPARAQNLIDNISVFKSNSEVLGDYPLEFLLQLNTTIGRIYRAAVSSEEPIVQATLEHSVPVRA